MTSMKARLMAGSLLSGLMAGAIASPVLAQEAGSQVEELVVTGSRIPRPNLEQPTPVSVATRELIENAGTQNLGDVIAQLPALSSSGTVRANGNSFGDQGGLNFPNLRDLGTSRTLTLVDGRRHVAGDAGDSAVDLNSIPTALVDRVEVVTGGASAVYGSDAVTGVINIITKKDFEGIEAQVEYGRHTEGGGFGAQSSAFLTLGHNFDSDRANVTFSAFWDQQEAIRANDIPSNNNYGAINLSDPFDGQPDRQLVPNVLSELIDENGVLLGLNATTGAITPLAGFTADGTPVTQPTRTGTNSLAFGSFAGPCATCFQLEDWILLVPPTKRRGLNSTFNYKLTPSINFNVDAKFVQTRVADYVQPSFSFGDFVLAPDNAFITPAIQARLDAAGPDVIPLIARFNGDVGARTNNITRETWRIVAGFDGEFDASFAKVNWDFVYNRGRTSNIFRSTGSVIPGNFEAALDSVRDPATGQIRCRVDVPSAQPPGYEAPAGLTGGACVPFNPFGQQNSLQAVDYVSHEAFRKHTIDQSVVTATFNFDTSRFLNLPGGAIGVAGGFEYRDERSENINDPFIKAGLSDTAPQPDASGGFFVKEAFIEARAPLLRDMRFVEELAVEGAVRYADYSTVGDATAWKIGGEYAPFQDIRFRGTYSRAVRAPNITEAFLPATSSFFDIADPCDAADIGRDPDRAANCAALGVPPGFVASDNQSVEGTASGNANLDPERAKSWTVGLVLQPRWTPNLSITLDYYNIKIKNAITFIDPQDIVDNCVDATGGPDESFCSLFTRSAVTGNIDFVESTYLNAARLETNGWDMAFNYRQDIADWTAGLGGLSRLNGTLGLLVSATHIDKLRLFAFQNRPDEQDYEEGTVGTPEWKGLATLSYQQGPAQLVWKSRFIGHSLRYNRDPQRDGAESISPATVEANWYHDVILHWRLDTMGGQTELYAGVNNLFDEEPPLGLIQGDGGDAAYDLGRYVFGGVRVRF